VEKIPSRGVGGDVTFGVAVVWSRAYTSVKWIMLLPLLQPPGICLKMEQNVVIYHLLFLWFSF
jgi:hypothetical protein